MAVYLNDVNGNPISLMGTGSTMWSSGAGTNTAQFGQASLFGPHLNSAGKSRTTPGAFAATTAGDTDLGYNDLAEGHGTGGGGLNFTAPKVQPRQLNADEPLDVGGTVGALADRFAGRTSAFARGMAEGKSSPWDFPTSGATEDAAGAGEGLAEMIPPPV